MMLHLGLEVQPSLMWNCGYSGGDNHHIGLYSYLDDQLRKKNDCENASIAEGNTAASNL